MTSSSQSEQRDLSAAQEPAPHRVRLATSLLRRAVQLFVRSQLTSVQHLEVDLKGGDRQLLAGVIPGVTLCAERAVYQGLHLSQIQVEGQNIQVNLGQVVRGKPLRLLDDIFVSADLTMGEADLNASLESPLLDDLICRLVHALAAYLPGAPSLATVKRSDIRAVQARYVETGLSLELVFSDTVLSGQTLSACAHFALQSAYVLVLQNVQIELGSPSRTAPSAVTIPEVQVPLGTDVEIQTLAIAQTALQCRGKIRVRP